jgi:DNA modification methylase
MFVELADWKGETNVVVHGDCTEALPRVADASIDMILTDLPYGVTQIDWDTIIPFDFMWKHLERITKSNAPMIFTASQPFASLLIASKPEWFKYEIIWVKNKATGHLNAKKMPMRNHENILVFYRQPPTYIPQMTNGHEPLHCAVNKNQTKLYGEYGGVESRTGATDRYPKSVVHFDVVNQTDRIHETQKPVELFAYLIKTFSNEGDVVLDPCSGSATTGVAASFTRRRYICIEKDGGYFEKAKTRFKPDLFAD